MEVQKILRERIAFIQAELSSLLRVLDFEGPLLPDETVEKVSKGICPECGKKILKEDIPKSKVSCHAKCYKKQQRLIEKGLTTSDRLTTEGRRASKDDLLRVKRISAQHERELTTRKRGESGAETLKKLVKEHYVRESNAGAFCPTFSLPHRDSSKSCAVVGAVFSFFA